MQWEKVLWYPGYVCKDLYVLHKLKWFLFLSLSGTGMQKIIFVLLYKCQSYPVLDTEISEDDDDVDLATLPCTENDIQLLYVNNIWSVWLLHLLVQMTCSCNSVVDKCVNIFHCKLSQWPCPSLAIEAINDNYLLFKVKIFMEVYFS